MCRTARQVHLLSPLILLLRAPSFLLAFPWLVLSSRPSLSSNAAVPNLFGTGFMEDSVSMDGGGGMGDGSGSNVSDGEQQMKLHSRAGHSPPAVRPVS